MKTITNTAPTSTNTTSAWTAPDVWLSTRELSTLRKSISAETLQELFEYHEDMWDVVCTGRKREYVGYALTNEVPQLDTFVRMLISDSQKLRGAKLKAANDAQIAAIIANSEMHQDPLWDLDSAGILVAPL